MSNNYNIKNIFQDYIYKYTQNHKLSKEQWKVVNAILNCKTAQLGFHIYTCEDCGEQIIGFNSCRNRHCPMCQFYAKEKWINNQNKDLLSCSYFHIVTTVPKELNEIALYNKEEYYKILFESTSEAIMELANDPKWLGAKVGITSILHTWGGTLEFHPHIHSIVTGGGIKNNKWIQSKQKYLFKVQVLSSLFRGKFLSKLKQIDLNLPEHLKYLKDEKELNNFLRPLYNKSWVTYIEPPKGSPENVIEYIGRYSFRIAISNERIKKVENEEVTFEYKDYKDNAKIKEMTISVYEFIRRFLMHVLPDRLTKIKHYGLYTNRNKKSNIKICRLLIGQYINDDFTINIKRKLHIFKCDKCECNKFNYSYFYPTSTRLT